MLSMEEVAPGISVKLLATDAEKGCPISNAIRGSVAVTVTATAR